MTKKKQKQFLKKSTALAQERDSNRFLPFLGEDLFLSKKVFSVFKKYFQVRSAFIKRTQEALQGASSV